MFVHDLCIMYHEWRTLAGSPIPQSQFGTHYHLHVMCVCLATVSPTDTSHEIISALLESHKAILCTCTLGVNINKSMNDLHGSLAYSTQ